MAGLSIRSLGRHGLEMLNAVSAALDRPYLRRAGKPAFAPVFILGAPRSGTTLLYQVLFNAFETAYLPNISNLFPMCPLAAARIGLRFCGRHESGYTSVQGFEKGWMAPSEAGNVWNRWFPFEKREGYNYTPAGFLSQDFQDTMRRMVADLESLFGGPFMTKNVKMSVRLQAIKEVFPDSRLIHIRRNILDTVISILEIRRRRKANWWSVMPKEIESIQKLPELEQVCAQVIFTESNILGDISLFPESWLNVDYDSLCADPRGVVDQVRDFLGPSAVAMRTSLIPESFPGSKPSRTLITDEEIRRIEELIHERHS